MSDEDHIREIPPDSDPGDDKWPLHCVALDRGSVGAASSHFIEHCEQVDIDYLHLTHFDKFHWLVRDGKNSLNRAGMTEVLLQSSYVWGLNYKPFGSGEWHRVKLEILENFMLNRNHNHPIFLKFVSRIALGFEMPYHGTEDERIAVFNRLSMMKSFDRKGPAGKLMRWFSWNGLCHFHLEEVWPMTMLLEDLYGDVDHVLADPETLANLRRDAKGFELANNILHQPDFFIRCKFVYVSLETSWTWYTDQVETILTPQDGLQERIAFNQLNWYDDEVLEHFTHCLGSSIDTLDWIGFTPIGGEHTIPQQDKLVGEYLNLVFHTGGARSWTKLSMGLPPYCYAGLASADPDIADQTMAKFKRDFANMLKLEDLAAQRNRHAKQLLSDLYISKKKALRLLYLLFERDGFRLNSVAGQRYLRAILLVPPDNKLLEDIHAYLRDLARHGRATMSSPLSRSAAACNSGRLEARWIPHATVTHDEFVDKFRSVEMRNKKLGAIFNSRRYALPEAVSNIMGKKDWPSPSPASHIVAVGAWLWLEQYMSFSAEKQMRMHCRAAWVTALLADQTVVYSFSHDAMFFPLSPSKYASPALHVVQLDTTMDEEEDADQVNLYWVSLEDGLTTIHVEDAMTWITIPTTPVGPKHLYAEYREHADSGMSFLFAQTGDPMSILRYKLLETAHHLTLEQLQEVCFEVGQDSHGTRPEVLERLARYLCASEGCEYRDELLQQMLSQDLNKQVTYGDITEQALDGLDPDDQAEFKDIKDHITIYTAD